MRIIGGKDYYDGATPFDTDETRVFIRHNHNKTEPIKVPEFRGLGWSISARQIGGPTYGSATPEYFYPLAIIFCGKIYNFVMFRKHNSGARWPNPSYYEEKMLWNRDALIDKLREENYDLIFKHYDTDRQTITRQTIDNYFEVKDVSSTMMEHILENKIIVAIRKSITDRYYNGNDDYYHWFLNTDALKEYGFGSVIDPYTANQEIDMFLGTILVRDEDNRVQLSDASKVKKHGFDKFSFRNQRHRGKPRKHA